MTTTLVPSRGLVLAAPLRDLAAWTAHFQQRRDPGPARDRRGRWKHCALNEERTDANSIGEMIGGDPLMTLKVLAYDVRPSRQKRRDAARDGDRRRW